MVLRVRSFFQEKRGVVSLSLSLHTVRAQAGDAANIQARKKPFKVTITLPHVLV